MKPFYFRLSIVLILGTLALGACDLPGSTPTPTAQPAVAYTQAAQTVAALLTEPSPTLLPAATNTPASQASETATPTPTQTVEPSPTISPTPDDCTNLLDFVDDITVPDDTAFLPGQTFTKTWRLRNIGTCTWTSAYSLVFVDGDQLNASSPVALPASVPPDTEVDLSVAMTAPGVPGTYTSNWMLRSPSGTNFGTQDDNGPFWAQIVVQEGSDALDLGSPDWRDPFDNASSWYLLDTDYTQFSVEDGRMVMHIIAAGGGEEWGLSARPGMDNYYLQATFITGETCPDADRYGVLVRAPDPDQGYVFGFSCSGRYRLYAWDGESYRPLQEWRASAAIRSGANQTNILGIWLMEDTIRLYANGQLLAEFTDDGFSSGQFGLFIGSQESADFTVYVDEISTWNLED